jgi:hypothetical protein
MSGSNDAFPSIPDAGTVTIASRGRSAWWPALLLLLASSLGTAWLELRPLAAVGAPIAAIFPPWWQADRTFVAAASAGGAVVRAGAWPNILVVTAEDGDLPRRLREAGAWLLVNPIALGGCFKE